MAEQTTKALFPLSAHILPGGRMDLRIFEARYIRMVKEACANDSLFCICMYNSKGDTDSNQHIYPLGTVVRIVDFDMLDDGLLGITVVGEELVKVNNIATDKDGLRTGQLEKVESAQFAIECDETNKKLVERLRQVIDDYPEIGSLYPEPDFQNCNWVIFRWLELLPLKAEEKQALLQQGDPQVVGNYLQQLLK